MGKPSIRAILPGRDKDGKWTPAPFAEQVAFFRQKLGNLVPTQKWDDILGEAHDRAFMVAGAAKADLLADLAAAVDKAIADGETLDTFKARFLDIVRRRGWAGWTGDDRSSDRPKGGAGVAWRARVIYETNLITSYAAGRLAQLKEAGYEYWVYRHSDFVRNPRPHHVALDGTVKRADDPFWKTYYPPNGWGCRCRVVGARSRDMARDLGGDPDKRLPEWVGEVDPKTGAPTGIDKGWAYQPGGTWRPWDKNAFAPECILAGRIALAADGDRNCIRAVEKQRTWRDENRPRIRDVPDELRLPFPGLLPAAVDRATALAMLAAELGVSAVMPRRWVQMNAPIQDNRILIDYSYLAHMVEKDQNRRERYAKFVLPTLTDPFEVWATKYDDGTIRRRLIGLFVGEKQLAVILRINKDGTLFWNMMNASDKRLDDFRTGALLYGK